MKQLIKPIPNVKREPTEGLTYCLFAERHDLPKNEGPVLDSFSWEDRLPRFTSEFYNLQRQLLAGHTCWLYLTGLTVAYSHVLKQLSSRWTPHSCGSLIVMHYDHERKEYFPVTVLQSR